MTTSDWIALGAGIYGSIVATCALIWNIIREKRKIVVRIRYAFSPGLFSGSEMLAIEVINKGRYPINIQEIGFFLSDGNKLMSPLWQHGLGWLRDGDGTSYYIPKQDIDDIVRQAKELKQKITTAYVRDSMSEYHRGKINKSAAWFSR